MPTGTLNQLPVYASQPANLSAVTLSTAGSLYAAGFANGPGSTTLSAATTLNATSLTVTSATSFYVGELALIDGGTTKAELVYITAIVTTTFTVQRMDGAGLEYIHASGATIVGTSAGIMPTYTGRVNIEVSGDITGNATNDIVTAQIIAIPATGAAGPSAGTALPGIVGAVQIGNTSSTTMTSGNYQGFGLQATVGGIGATNSTPAGGAALSVGVPYLFDVIVSDTSQSSKTATLHNVGWSIQEI